MGILSWLFNRGKPNHADPDCWRCRGSGSEYTGYGFETCGCVGRNVGTMVNQAQQRWHDQQWREDEAARQRAGVDRQTWEAHKAQLRDMGNAVRRPVRPTPARQPSPEDLAAREAAMRRPVSPEEFQRRLREEGL